MPGSTFTSYSNRGGFTQTLSFSSAIHTYSYPGILWDTVISSPALTTVLCSTLAPGETASVSILDANVTCSTSSVPGTTSTYITFTTRWDAKHSTSFADVAVATSVVVQPTISTSCDLVLDYKNPDTCKTVQPFTWAALVGAFVSVQLTWWIFDIRCCGRATAASECSLTGSPGHALNPMPRAAPPTSCIARLAIATTSRISLECIISDL